MTVQAPHGGERRIETATAADAEAIMGLYRAMIGRPGCTWNEHYPTPALLARDLRDGNVYVMRDGAGAIIATLAIDQDEAVDALPCWSLAPGTSRELARLCVRADYQNQGVARQMLRFGMAALKARGYQGVHFLVSPQNPQALASYAKLGFRNVGTAEVFGQSWYCYEKQWNEESI
jgi:ribosomal protein S18 acetylase RimI-like enzyme